MSQRLAICAWQDFIVL
jgi:hypothetical protein